MVVNVVIFIKMRCVVLKTDGPEDGYHNSYSYSYSYVEFILPIDVNIDHYYHTLFPTEL